MVDFSSQTVVIGGGSQGLGRELAELMILRGADVIILARNSERLATVKNDLCSLCIRKDQLVQTYSIDLADAEQVEDFVMSLRVVPSHVFFVAGGCPEEVGLFVDVTPKDTSSCIQRNYLSSAFLAHAMIRLWLKHPQEKATKHLVFTLSTAVFAALPGYAAYTPSKAAVRALADTLRQEVLMYEPIVKIRIQCSFPGNFVTESFAREQERKPELCKLLEGSESMEDTMTIKDVAKSILVGVDRDRYLIMMDMQTRLLFNNKRGPSPSETYVWDWLLGFIASLVWPLYRMMFDSRTRRYGIEQLEKNRKLED
ncbi:putative oxidoreductase,short chain dehydrogenase [Xylogone sp. PMI_703]|nr:putative oxidoreductase,short chain dehydrogenase [Xylogone sp. PMI_703]